MKRQARLQSARHWLPGYRGKNVVRGYAKWFGVDHRCAIIELGMLGVEIDPRLIENFEKNQPRPKRPPEPDLPEGYGIEWDDDFEFIAGFTSGGAPFGIPWDA